MAQQPAPQVTEQLTFLCLMVLGDFEALERPQELIPFGFIFISRYPWAAESASLLTVLSFGDNPELIVRSQIGSGAH